jgi:hypothetical protein
MKSVDFYAASCRKPLQNHLFYGTATLGNAGGFEGGDSCVFPTPCPSDVPASLTPCYLKTAPDFER